MKFYPDIYLNNLTEITEEFLKENNIKGLILDIDNTIIDYDKNMLQGVEKWCEDLKSHGIKMCIVSNTNKKRKVEKVAKTLNLKYIYFAHKPGKKGFRKAQEILDLKAEEIATVGDQIFTDVFGGNRMGMYTILTKPIDERDIILTRIKRPFERIVIKKYLKHMKKGDK